MSISDGINAVIRLLNQDIELLEVTDRFFHQSLELMKEGLSYRFPSYSEEKIMEEIRDVSSFSEKI